MKDAIKDFLPEEYKDARVDVRENTKLNETYTALTVRREDQVVAPAINLNQMYEQFDENDPASLQNLLETAAHMIQMEAPGVDINALSNYEQAKEHLFIRVSSVETNKAMLANAPHKLYEDLAVTYHIAVDIGREGVASTMVTNEMLQNFGISQEQLHEDAVVNSEKIFPARVESMGAVMRRMMGEDLKASGMSQEDIDMMMDSMGIADSNPMTVVSNEQSVNGAAVLFYKGQMDQIGEKLEGDFFVLPSSVHEMLVVPDTGEFQHEELKAMVTEINETQVAPSDRLTDEVYHYDTKDRVFEKAADFDQRQKTKEKAAAKEAGHSDPAKSAEHGSKPKHKRNDMSL